MTDNSAALRRARRQDSRAKRERAAEALAAAEREGAPISFPVVARRAGVSVSLLYSDASLSSRIATARDRQRQAGTDRAWHLPARSLVTEQSLRAELANAKERAHRLAEEVIDDLVSRSIEPGFLQLRLEAVSRGHRRMRELEMLREAAAMSAQTDRLTGVYNRETILSMIFRETDRVQRMKSPLSMILFDIDDFGHWNSLLGAGACDDLLCQAAGRTARLLRSYDLLGRPGMDEFLVALPGCDTAKAGMLAERLRVEVFSSPFHIEGEAIRLSACFGVASSHGRSPVVVLRDPLLRRLRPGRRRTGRLPLAQLRR